ncbi:hypothetical protein HY522_12415 [bacterium]|nr:hypothetical protein [bacterium]
MSILIRRIGKREYAYRVVREGRRVRHVYLGRAGDPAVAAQISAFRETAAVPERFSRFFWDTDSRKIDLRRHRKYVIERILELGNYSAFLWICRVYPGHLIRRVNDESRAISPISRNFWRVWLDG